MTKSSDLIMENVKPVLVVHPKFYNIVNQNSMVFSQLLDLINFEVLTDQCLVTDFPAYVLTNGSTSVKPYTAYLENYDQVLDSGSNAAITSYYFDDVIEMYHITDKRPRYVIWNYEPTLICSTVTDRITSDFELHLALERAKSWAQMHSRRSEKSIIVFDLDDTLIDSNLIKLDGADLVLQWAKEKFGLVVLWSHGDSLYVQEQIKKHFSWFNFDLVLARDPEGRSCKNLLHIYNHFPNTYFSGEAILVDDTVSNWTPEYTKMIVPLNTNNISPLLDS